MVFCRYGAGDKVEAWLNELLCLNASEHVPKPPPQLPQLEECELFYVERDTLFSFHKVPLQKQQPAHPCLACSSIPCTICSATGACNPVVNRVSDEAAVCWLKAAAHSTHIAH